MAMYRLQYLPDSELVEMARRGSLEACDELVRRFRPAVLLAARQIVDSPEAAQDAAQDAFTAAFRALPQLQDTARFAAWLYAITRHRARRMALRGQRTRAHSLADLADCAPDTQAIGPLDALLQAESREAVRAALSSLAPPQQIVMQLFYYEQWPMTRIAAFLGLPLTTIKWRLREGRKQLAAALHALLNEEKEGEQGKTKSKRQKAEDAAK